jgi:3-methylcrotonyl-CoA carboxylase alpha subunit
MEYKLKMDDIDLPVIVSDVDDGSFTAVMNDQEYRVEFVRTSDNTLLMTVNGRQTPVVVVVKDDGKTICINGCSYELVDEDALAQSVTGRKSSRKQPLEVTPPMPAVVVKINVSTGDAVTEGQPVVVVSAMKMETTLYAPFDGVVTGVNTAEGDKVMPGDILVDIQKTDEAGTPQGGDNE